MELQTTILICNSQFVLCFVQSCNCIWCEHKHCCNSHWWYVQHSLLRVDVEVVNNL